MELVSLYLYNRIPVETSNIKNSTFHSLKRNGWYTDKRNSQKFTLLNKRIEHEGKWYRTLIRFPFSGLSSSGEELYTLSLPTPFLVTQCEPLESVTSDRWKDNTVFHGPKLGSVSEMMRAGVPAEVIDVVFKDLKEHIRYTTTSKQIG